MRKDRKTARLTNRVDDLLYGHILCHGGGPFGTHCNNVINAVSRVISADIVFCTRENGKAVGFLSVAEKPVVGQRDGIITLRAIALGYLRRRSVTVREGGVCL